MFGGLYVFIEAIHCKIKPRETTELLMSALTLVYFYTSIIEAKTTNRVMAIFLSIIGIAYPIISRIILTVVFDDKDTLATLLCLPFVLGVLFVIKMYKLRDRSL